jgi:hypothetical protein
MGVEPICAVLPIAPSTYHSHVALSLFEQFIEKLPGAANFGRDRDDCCPTRMLALVIQNHPHRTIANLRRKIVRRLACHRSTFSRVGASDKPGGGSTRMLASASMISIKLGAGTLGDCMSCTDRMSACEPAVPPTSVLAVTGTKSIVTAGGSTARRTRYRCSVGFACRR